MQIDRDLELDTPLDDVWHLLTDPDELAGWVGEEVRGVAVVEDAGARRLTWSWAPDGVASTVELTLTENGDRTRVHVVERSAATASARACTLRWDDALLNLELKALSWTHRLVSAGASRTR